MIPAALLLLSDGRFPAGGHAHSGGLEVAVADGAVHDLASLEAFLRGRLHTQGLVQAALAAAACGGAELDDLDAEADARHPAAVQRKVSRAQGRALLRAGRAIWPHERLDALAAAHPAGPTTGGTHLGAGLGGPHQAVAFGAVAACAGVDPGGAALASALGAVSGPATAAVRLLGLDPYGVHAVLARLGAACEAVAVRAVEAASRPLEDLPACSGPRLDIDAVRHEHWEVRLFAS